MIGKVRWFNPVKGFGFITSESTDYFVFYKSINMNGYRKLRPSQKVKFDVGRHQNHQQAINVEVIHEE